MKRQHTSDWLLGATCHDRVRDADEEHTLDQIVAGARDRAVDAVVIARDVFVTATLARPSSGAGTTPSGS
jgi:exonuclease SbcD